MKGSPFLEQSNSLDVVTTKSQEKRWLVENFASRAALLAFIYLCVNIIYQQGYLSQLGFEFGLFSIARTLPLLFDNFIIATYAFIAWGFITEVTPSTYDQLFGFFNPVSWRDHSVKRYRFIAIAGVAIYYIILHAAYLLQTNQILIVPINWSALLDSIFSVNLIAFWAFTTKLLIPTWGFVFWWPSILSVLILLISFRMLNTKYRRIRNMGLYQLLKKNRNLMFIQINLITPALSILAGFFFLVMIPGFIGSITATLTIKNIYASKYQQVDKIELSNVTSFCGEVVLSNNSTAVWKKNNKDNFTIHLLGSIGGYDLFAKVADAPKIGTANIIVNGGVSYVPCLISSGITKSIILHQNTLQ